ncbi:MAG: ABC transporter ATP-binding protein [Alphaproteobacteria bacterium]|jgi:urea transport system ATP-binding protein|nr:MAG: ABC transporter ATP-binding protein [Alphaproteobacteria bacterium]|tara:strand:- start:3819 stop:4559 length:741 start_codon:yes stop_codon:yes gene_type:complete
MITLLEVDNVSVSFDGFKAVNNLSFTIGYNELQAIIGPNGAGKTTFMDIITGQTKPDSGNILWGEKSTNLIKKNETEIALLGIGRKFQKPTVFENKSLIQNLILSQKKNRNPFNVLFQRNSEYDIKNIIKILKDINLFKIKDKRAGDISHGQKQWLEIGMLLTQNPKLLLVDEPAAGMTPNERNQTVQILKKLSKSSSIIVVEHDMEFVRNLNCRVTVLNEGSILSSGSIDFVSQNEEVIEVYLGR